MIKFIGYFFLCMLSIFADMCFNFNGYITLIFNFVFACFVFVKYNLDFKFKDFNLFIFTVGGCIVNIIFVILIEIVISFFIKIDLNYNYYISIYSIFSLILMAFAEEIIFRAYFLNILIKKYKISIAVLLISIIFATIHLFVGKNPLIAFCGSIFLSLIYIKKKSIFSTIMIHLTSNFFVVFFLANILSLFTNLGAKSKIQSFFLILLFLIFLIKYLFKKSDK